MYTVTVKKNGMVEKKHKIEADSALAAINQVESDYKARPVVLSGKNQEVHRYEWTGYEFVARLEVQHG